MTVRLKQPHGTYNPNGFDFEAWALERGIRATGYVRNGDTAERLSRLVWRPGYLVQRLRENVRDRYTEVLHGRPYEGVLRALAIGDESGISRADWQVFLRTGVNHLMSMCYVLKHYSTAISTSSYLSLAMAALLLAYSRKSLFV